MKAQTMKQIGTALIVIGLAGAYYTIAIHCQNIAIEYVRNQTQIVLR